MRFPVVSTGADMRLVVDRAADEFEAHVIDLTRWRLDLMFDLIERECVTGAFVPVALAVNGVKIKPGRLGGGPPIVAFMAGDALHGRR